MNQTQEEEKRKERKHISEQNGMECGEENESIIDMLELGSIGLLKLHSLLSLPTCALTPRLVLSSELRSITHHCATSHSLDPRLRSEECGSCVALFRRISPCYALCRSCPHEHVCAPPSTPDTCQPPTHRGLQAAPLVDPRGYGSQSRTR